MQGGRQCRPEKQFMKRRIEKHQIELLRVMRLPHPGQGICLRHLHVGGLQPPHCLDQVACQDSLALDQRDRGCASGRGLQAQRTTARKGIEHTPALHVLAQPIEQRLTHTTGCRPQSC
jgi:hypothetical protein